MLRKYEICMLLEPQLDHNVVESEISGISEIMASNGINIVHKELWGKRALVYPIKKKNEGYYYLFYVESEPDALKKIQEILKHRESILRMLIIAKKEFPETVKNGQSKS